MTAKSQKSKSNLGSLLQTGKYIEAKIISTTTSEEPQNTSLYTIENTELQKQDELAEAPIKSQELSEKNTIDSKLESILCKNGISQNVIVRIPDAIHRRIKLLSVGSGVPISDIVTNILSSYLDSNNKDIDKYLKTMMK